MSKIGCSVSDCNSPSAKAGMCNKHYIRNRKYGDPLIRKQRYRGETSLVVPAEGYAKVELTKGKWAIIDTNDIEKVREFSWHYLSTGYAYSTQCNLLLHQFVIGKAPNGYETDHINRDKLDCRKENLRHITYSDNTRNSISWNETSSCTYDVIRKKWKAIFKYHGKTIYSGYFLTKEAATKASRDALEKLELQGI